MSNPNDPQFYPSSGIIAKLKQQRRRARVLKCSRQAMQAKQRMISTGKGKHGRSMSPDLLARHAAA